MPPPAAGVIRQRDAFKNPIQTGRELHDRNSLPPAAGVMVLFPYQNPYNQPSHGPLVGQRRLQGGLPTRRNIFNTVARQEWEQEEATIGLALPHVRMAV